ncbi:glutathione S-transferase N-terminal domain-containing protein [Endothiovibrio diazotrophicus]
MALIANKRSVMTLFSAPLCPESHRTRIVLAEKGITHDVVDIDPNDLPEDLIDLNPYNNVPTLVDRDLVLYNARVIMEYLDERFPHPPLMPVDPVARARTRLGLYRIEHDWYGMLGELETKSDKKASAARKQLREQLIASNELFGAAPFFLSDELTLADCSLTPLLWRLPHWGIELPAQAKAVTAYAERMFARESFRESLSEAEKELR